MRVISLGTLKEFWAQPGRGDAEQPLRTWVKVVRAAEWSRPTDVKTTFRTADILPNGRAIFDIGGNKYRLVVAIHYRGGGESTCDSSARTKMRLKPERFEEGR
jgi:mRNA interferase HigB